MLTEALLAKRVFEYVIEKKYAPEAQEAVGEFRRNRRVVFRARWVPYFKADPSDVMGVPGPVVRRINLLRVPHTKRRLVRRGHSTGLPTKATQGPRVDVGLCRRRHEARRGPYGCSPSLMNTPGNAMCSEPTGPSNQATRSRWSKQRWRNTASQSLSTQIMDRSLSPKNSNAG